MLEFTYAQRGQLPVDAVKRAIVDAHQRAVIRLLNELTINVSGRVVQSRTGRLRAALEATTVQGQTGETISTVGFNAGRRGRAFVARFLERGTAGPSGDVVPKRNRRTRHNPLGKGGGKRALSFVVGGGRIFVSRVRNRRGITARPILGTALQIAAPAILEDFKLSLDKALHG